MARTKEQALRFRTKEQVLREKREARAQSPSSRRRRRELSPPRRNSRRRARTRRKRKATYDVIECGRIREIEIGRKRPASRRVYSPIVLPCRDEKGKFIKNPGYRTQ